MRIALAQITATTQPQDNLLLVGDRCRRAASAGAELVVFPEATMCSFTRASGEVAEPLDGPWATTVRELAAKLGITVVAGMFTTADDGRVHNTLLVTGAVEVSYDKIHLYDALGHRESDQIAPGTQPVVVEIGGASVGLATCYDLRFPGLFTALAGLGAEVIVVPAAWAPGPGKLHQWRTLTTARALDSTSIVVAVDQAGVGDIEMTGPPTGVGGSMAVAADGAVLLELGVGPELVVLDVDPSTVADVREQLPVLRNARPISVG